MPRPPSTRRRSAGFSLIELLVSMTIGLVVTLAITSVLIRTEGGKRSSTSVNDINQTGSYVAYVLDRALRNAGSGFSQNWGTFYGCLLNASSSGARVLPLPTAFPASSAFSGFALPTRLAPVIIGKGLANSGGITGGDVLMVMGGTAGAAETPLQVSPNSVQASSPAQFQVTNNLGYQANNVVVLADTGLPAGCLVEQVNTTITGSSAQTVPLAGTYFTTTGSTVTLANFSTSASTMVAQLGVDAVNPPQFQLFGVGANNALFSYDLLQAAGNESTIADGVVEMRAIYGLTGTPANNLVASWIDPVAGSGYEPSVLLNGSPTSNANLRNIVAVRVGFFMRTSLQERAQDYQQASGTALTLFSDAVNAGGTSIKQTRTLSGTDLNYRWRTFEVTVPLINVQNAQ